MKSLNTPAGMSALPVNPSPSHIRHALIANTIMKTQNHTSSELLSNTPAPPPLLAEFGDRLVTLCDGRPGLRGGLEAEIREPDAPPPGAPPAPPILDFIASSGALDRYEEIITPAGWQLENYRRNPVFQNAHQYGDIIFTLGKALLTEVREVGGRQVLYQRIEFAVEANPIARIAYGLYKGRFLNAVSVGFIPLRWENGAADAGYRRKYLEQELLEVSAVGIPANPEALQLGLKAGVIQKTDLHELLELLRSQEPRAEKNKSKVREQGPGAGSQGPEDGEPGGGGPSPTLDFGLWTLDSPSPFRSQPAASDTHACASGVRNNEAHWLQLARALRDILRRT